MIDLNKTEEAVPLLRSVLQLDHPGAAEDNENLHIFPETVRPFLKIAYFDTVLHDVSLLIN